MDALQQWLISKRQEAGLSQLELAQCLEKPAEYGKRPLNTPYEFIL